MGSMKSRIQAHLRDHIHRQLQEKSSPIQGLQREVSRLRDLLKAQNQQLKDAEAQIKALKEQLEAAEPFHAKMTVHQAWAKHSGVREIFSKHHLPHCDKCPVGADERLEEVAFGYAIDLESLLRALNGLC